MQSTLSIYAHGMKVEGTLSISAGNVKMLDLSGAGLSGGITLRGTFQDSRRFDWTVCAGKLDWRDCTFVGDLDLRDVHFDPQSPLDLRGTTIVGSVYVLGQKLLPATIRMDGLSISKECRIEAQLGEPRVMLEAWQDRPQFDGPVVLTNVDLSGCRLVGNVFQRMQLSNVHWRTYRGRSVLFEEMVFSRVHAPTMLIRYAPPSNLREAYQVLKEHYRQLGDHVKSGDFHYGEMEMKRREHGRVGRGFPVEFLYWAVSGYGMRYLRAGAVWLGMVGAFALAYWASAPEAFSWSVPEALRASIQVATLQRQPLPDDFYRLTHWLGPWLYVAETILGPLQLALFALALRMRLKR